MCLSTLKLFKFPVMKRIIRYIFIFALVISFTETGYSQSDEILFRRSLLQSGWNGFFYGLAFDHIFDIDGPAAAGLPVITAGTCVLVPLLSNSSKTVTSNRLLLSGHGQTLGWVHGMALGAIINNNDAFDEQESKLTVGLGAATSIGLGILGNHLAKTKDWSEGRVALYRHYGWIAPMTGICAAATFSEDLSVFGISDLLFTAGGYLVADRVNSWNEFTRGEVRSTQVLSALNGALGFCVFIDTQVDDEDIDFNRTGWILPAVGLIGGTAIGHFWLKNADFTPQQGMTTIYAAAGGFVIGAGIDLLIDSEEFTPNYLIPYITSMGAYTFAVQKLKNSNRTASLIPKESKGTWDFAFLPQNILLNNKLGEKGILVNGKYTGMQPCFSASLTF